MREKMEEIKNEDRKKDIIIRNLLVKDQIRLINEEIKKKYQYILKYTIKTINECKTECYTISKKLKKEKRIVLPIVQFTESTNDLLITQIEIDMSKYNEKTNELFVMNSGSELIKGIKHHIKIMIEENEDELLQSTKQQIHNHIKESQKQQSSMDRISKCIEKTDPMRTIPNLQQFNQFNQTSSTLSKAKEKSKEKEKQIKKELKKSFETIPSQLSSHSKEKKETKVSKKMKQYYITIPIHLAFTGGIHMFVFNNTEYQIQINQGCEENCSYTIENCLFIIKYKQDNFFRRENDNLIVKLQYEKKYENRTVTLPYILKQISLPSVILKQKKYSFEGYGFLNTSTNKRGNYIVQVELL